MDKDAVDPAGGIIDIGRIMDMIPHRYPFLMLDRIIAFEPGEQAVGLKNVTINEPHFMGHFPGRPVMPGVMMIEAMAQTAGVLVVATLGTAAEGSDVYFLSVDNARFRKPVTPGDTLHITVTRQHRRGNVWRFKGEVTVDGGVVAEATFAAMILDKGQ